MVALTVLAAPISKRGSQLLGRRHGAFDTSDQKI